MLSQKQKFVGVLSLLASTWALAEPVNVFRATGVNQFELSANVLAERARFFGLFNSSVQSYGFEDASTGATAPLAVAFNGSTTPITATLQASTGSMQMVRDQGDLGRYNTTPDGRKYWQVSTSGNATFSIEFNQAISAFGFYGTDIGDFGGTLTLVLTPSDSALGEERIVLRDETEGRAGNALASFYGFADVSKRYSKISFVTSGILLDGAATDFFGFDDFVVADAGQFVSTTPPAGVPEPGSLALVGLALAAAAGAARRRKA